MAIKLIIFDLDGTLVDTSEDITAALNYAIKPYGIKELGVQDTIKIVGEGITRLIERVLGEDKSGVADDARQRFLDYYSEHLTDYSKPYPHVREVLEKLKDFKKAVISNKREALSVSLLRRLGLFEYFDLIVGSDTTSEKKPSPVPVRHILSRLGFSPSESIIVGDSTFDIEAGKKAGIKTVAVTYGYRQKEELKAADFIIDGFNDLAPILYGTADMPERRRERRHPIPEIYQNYITLRIKVSGESASASLLDFSEHGLKIKSPIPFDAGDVRECAVSIPMSLTRDVLFKISVRHCIEEDGSYIIGAEIEEVQDKVWFRIFKKVHDFISEKAYFHETKEE